MAYGAFVQDETAQAIGTSVNTAFTSTPTAGNSITVGVFVVATGHTLTVTDSQSQVYTASPGDVSVAGGGGTLHANHTANIAGAATTVTATKDGGSVTMAMGFGEYEGEINGVHQSNSASGTSATPNAGNITTTVNALIMAWGGRSSGSPITWTQGGGYTKRQTLNRLCPEDKVLGSGTYSGDFTLSVSSSWAAIVIAFDEAGGGPAGPPALVSKFALLGVGI